MGYWIGWENFYEWACHANYQKRCAWCSGLFIPRSGNQKYCSREDNPECDDDRYLDALWQKGKHPLQINPPFGEEFMIKLLGPDWRNAK